MSYWRGDPVLKAEEELGGREKQRLRAWKNGKKAGRTREREETKKEEREKG